ncbi:MAG: IS630 family transposase [Candidatus Scalindua rubra]|uniref:Tc1-like transposase DDE domain-containing protein n=1 Tax=Candidatus Scalindua brodae TaxID=237368 RepID=A0A0B0EMT5_9BACT|nr:MAG: hypothetical protein SCABRO_01787 [Candidatus Scalindua brodae]MBZ0108787.1 IS630 family transposase [Candidatus Scalindua rubra]
MHNRKTYTLVEKVSILRQNLVKKMNLTSLCQEHNLHPTMFYRWRNELFENGHRAFSKRKTNVNSFEKFKYFIIGLLKNGYSASEIYNELRQKEDFSSSSYSVEKIVKEQCHHFRSPIQQKVYLDSQWILKLLQGKISCNGLTVQLGGEIGLEDIEILVHYIHHKSLYQRNRAITVLSYYKGIPLKTISKTLFLKTKTVEKQIHRYEQGGINQLFKLNVEYSKMSEDSKFQEAVFSILHAPPSSYNINRTSWRMEDIYRVMREKGLPISKHNIRTIIKNDGYQFRKAKKVLTSTDPDYQEKLQEITKILANLKPTQKFFSIDEYGPFAVKMQGGKSLMKQGEIKTIPQRQQSKGSLIITGALELSTNQMTHFYSDKKNTEEMNKLLDILLEEYNDEERIFFSWDAASWHASKGLYEKVEEVNSSEYQTKHNTPIVELAPLPSCAQFLNVIESVFSGMAKAIIHNSDYASVEECKKAIDRHFAERNQCFKENPKRAGNKIWGKEITKAEFSESNNCKNPRYR